MSLIETGMERQFLNLIQSSVIHEWDDGFGESATDSDSYYTNYDDSKHFADQLMLYDFESPADIKKYLDELWTGRDDLKKYVVQVLMRTRSVDQNMLEEVKGYNYTL